MDMSKNKTTANDKDVLSFIHKIEHQKRKEDSLVILKLMESLFPDKPMMWGGSIIGFGQYHYKYESGREGDFFKTGFSPRKNALSVYIMDGFERFPEQMKNLGKYTTGKSCLYIRKLEDIDMDVLTELLRFSYDYMTEKYG
jgi:hypothetical protein